MIFLLHVVADEIIFPNQIKSLLNIEENKPGTLKRALPGRSPAPSKVPVIL